MRKRLYCQFKNIFSSQQKGEKILLSTFSILKKNKYNPQKTLVNAVKRLHTGLKIITKIRSGRPKYLPAYQFKSSANYYAIRWLYKAAKEKTSKSFDTQLLVNEIKDTLLSKGRAYKSKLDLIKEIRKSRVNLRKRFKRNFFKYKFKRKVKRKFTRDRVRNFLNRLVKNYKLTGKGKGGIKRKLKQFKDRERKKEKKISQGNKEIPQGFTSV